jgi:hypothetical protein
MSAFTGMTTALLAIAALAAIGERSVAIAGQGDRVRIERVPANREGTTPVYRVRVAGRFPPRAERYELLADGQNSAEVLASEVGNEALAYPLLGRHQLGHVILNQLRFPLSRFVGVDLTDVRAVELRFSRAQRGVIDIADLAFSAPPG